MRTRLKNSEATDDELALEKLDEELTDPNRRFMGTTSH